MIWTESQKATVKDLWEQGTSARVIAAQLHTSRNAICGLVNRNHWVTPNMPNNQPRKEKPKRQVPVNIVRERRAKPVYAPDLDPAPTIDDLAIPMEQRRTILQLTNKTCRWPVGCPSDVDFFYCGAQPDQDSPYCAAHKARSIQPRRFSPAPRFNLPSLRTNSR